MGFFNVQSRARTNSWHVEMFPLPDFSVPSWTTQAHTPNTAGRAKPRRHLHVQFQWHFREALGGKDPLVFLPKPCCINKQYQTIRYVNSTAGSGTKISSWVLRFLPSAFNMFSYVFNLPLARFHILISLHSFLCLWVLSSSHFTSSSVKRVSTVCAQ